MKRCCTCHEIKPLADFHRRSAAPDGRQSRCKACFAQQYRDSGDVLRDKVRARDLTLRARKIRLMGEYLADRCCVDCGASDLRVLDFDHRDGVVKRSGIAQMLLGGWTWKAVLSEIEKCDLRCANCHRIRTAGQQGWWKQALAEERNEAENSAASERLRGLLPS